jgi:probable HAF family extracellular repeat protein
MGRTWWHKLFSEGQSGVQRGYRRARVRQPRMQKPLLESLEERCLLSYQITNLGALASTDDSFANGINNSGQVVGSSQDDYGFSQAFLWDATNGMQGIPGGRVDDASGINDNGQVVGDTFRFGPIRAFLWDAVHGIRDVGHLPGNTSSEAFGINNNGQVAGVSFGGGDPFPPAHAFLWDAVNGMQDLGTLPGDRTSSAYGINDSGQVVGESNSGSVSGSGHAFLWDATNGMEDLGTLPGDRFSRALGINGSGQVVGDSYTDLFAAPHAFLWDAVNGMQALGTGDTRSVAYGINDSGQVVGSSSHGAFVWQNGTMSDLNDLIPPGSGWSLGVASAINNAGQIVGGGGLSGQTRAFLLTPDSSPRTDPAGTVHFPRSDAQAALLAGSTVTAADAGVHPFSLTPATLGDQTLTGTDPAEATRIGRATAPVTGDAAAPAGRLASLTLTSAVAAPRAEVSALERALASLSSHHSSHHGPGDAPACWAPSAFWGKAGVGG